MASQQETIVVDLENAPGYKGVPVTEDGRPITNPTWDYYTREEKLHGFLSQQFPTTANPAPLGLCGFALTTFVLSMMNAGGLRCKYLWYQQLLFICNRVSRAVDFFL